MFCIYIVWALFKNEIGSNSEKRVLKTCPSPIVFDYLKKVKKKMKSQCSHCADLSCDSIAKSSTWLQLFIKFLKQTLSITQGLYILALVLSCEFKDWQFWPNIASAFLWGNISHIQRSNAWETFEPKSHARSCL